MEGIINPLAVRDPWRCSACGNEWLDYDIEEEETVVCPRCQSSAVARIRG